MKKTLIAALLAAALLLAGCSDDTQQPTPTPIPEETAGSPAIESTPTVEQTPQAPLEPSGSPTVAEDIADFVEGAAVEAEKLPAAITEAIKGKYPVATIKGASYATYDDKQTYKIVVENAEDEKSEEVYVTANGEIIPASDAPATGDTGNAGNAADDAANAAGQGTTEGK